MTKQTNNSWDKQSTSSTPSSKNPVANFSKNVESIISKKKKNPEKFGVHLTLKKMKSKNEDSNRKDFVFNETTKNYYHKAGIYYEPSTNSYWDMNT